MIDADTIYTDANGVPFERPEPPPLDSPWEAKRDYLRAINAYRDRITDLANASFNRAFRKALHK